MPPSDPIRRFLMTLRTQPRVAAATAATALAAIVAGAGMAMALGGAREAAASPTTNATSVAATASPSPTPSATPRPADSPTPIASATPTPSASPVPTVAATPTPMPPATPIPTRRATPSPTPVADPNWTALPSMPNADDHHLRDALVLVDGRVVAVRHRKDSTQSISMVTIRPGDDRWTTVELSRPLDDRVVYMWAQAGDGRIYSQAWAIDPAGERWTVEPFEPQLTTEASGVIASDAAGRLFVGEQSDASFAIFEPRTGEWTRSAPNTVIESVETVLTSDDRLYLLAIDEYAAYEPATDTWTERARHPWIHASRAGLGPDGRIYVLDTGDFGPRVLNAIDPETDIWSEVPRPLDAPDPWDAWNPIFLTGPDGRLWAVDAQQSYVYVGD